MSVRILFVISPMSAGNKWASESGILLPMKLARYLARNGLAHTHIAISEFGDSDFLQSEPFITIHRLPGLYPSGIVASSGYPPDPGALIPLILEIGPDVIIVFNGLLATMMGQLIEADRCTRLGNVNIPLILWDGTPIGYDIVERGHQKNSPMVAGGYLAAERIWCFGPSHAKAVQTEVTRQFGYAAAQAAMQKSKMLPIAIDREYMDRVVGDVEKRTTFTVHVGGRWSQTKNYGTVANVVFKMKAAGVNINLLSTGMPSTAAEFKKALAEIDMEVASGLSQEDMWRVAKTCHVGVLAQDPQALPAMPFEQMALGLPVLVRSTERTPDVLPRYPLVWSTEQELLMLLTNVMEQYDQAVADVREWFEENWRNYDISLVAPEMAEVSAILKRANVALNVLEDGTVKIPSAGTSMVIFTQSLWRRTMARREAQYRGKHVERLELPIPTFVPIEEQGQQMLDGIAQDA